MIADRRPFPIVALITVLVVWSLLAYAFVFMFSGSHVCAIVQGLGTSRDGSVTEAEAKPAPMTQAEMDAATARCNRPDIGAITVFGIGYIVIAASAVRRAVLLPRAKPV